MITDLQKQRLAKLAEMKTEAEREGLVTKDCGYGVLVVALPEYGEEKAEQLLIESTEPDQGEGGEEGRPGGEGGG